MGTVVLTNGSTLVKKPFIVSSSSIQSSSSSGRRCLKVGVAGGRRVPKLAQSSTPSMQLNRSHVEVKSGTERKISNSFVEEEEEEEEGLFMDELEKLGEMALQDGGRLPEDYERRAKLFEELAKRVSS